MLHKLLAVFLTVTCLTSLLAEPQKIQGSDTLGDVMKDAVNAAKVADQLHYVGGGSGKGEEAIINQTQGIAPMSREMTAEAKAKAENKGIHIKAHEVAADGVAMLVNNANTLKRVDLGTLKKIYSCEIKRWEDVPGGDQYGKIVVYRRDDASGTTDTVKHLIGIKTMGDCATVLNSPTEMAERTAKESGAIGYAGLSALILGKNRALSVAKTASESAVEPTADSIKKRTYPLSRLLYVYEASGSSSLSPAESELMRVVADRSQMDRIVEKHNFYALP